MSFANAKVSCAYKQCKMVMLYQSTQNAHIFRTLSFHQTISIIIYEIACTLYSFSIKNLNFEYFKTNVFA